MCGFECMECGYAFKTIKAAEKASFGPKGCPKCGGSDIDLARTKAEKAEAAEHAKACERDEARFAYAGPSYTKEAES